ncbi:MAG: segregation and condensation protein A [Desulfomonilaceae bacterium]
MPYEVRLDFFEGPLDLLLHLIQKNQVCITDIPIALITRQYLDAIDGMESLNLDIAGEYLVMAAYLVHIKSQMLLPPRRVEEEDLEQPDPRSQLVAHLLEYKRYKEIASCLDALPLLDRDVFTRPLDEEQPTESRAAQPINGNIYELLAALRSVMSRNQPTAGLTVASDEILIEDKFRHILSRLKPGRWLTLVSLLDNNFSRANIVVTLIALLELVKRGAARMYQDQPFGTVLVYAAEQSVAAADEDMAVLEANRELDRGFSAPLM